jgi:hypothetical protein
MDCAAIRRVESEAYWGAKPKSALMIYSFA